MSKKTDNVRCVVRRGEKWAVMAPHASRASGIYRTQREAESRAKKIVKNLGGGEVPVQNLQGRWRDSDTVPQGNDPFPPKDTKH